MALMIKNKGDQWYPLNSSNELEGIHDIRPLVTERIEKVSLPFGDMELVQLYMNNIYIVYGDMRMYEPLLRMRGFNLPDMVELHFSLKGGGIIDNRLDNTTYNFHSNEHNIFYVPELDGDAIYNVGVSHEFFEIHFTSSHFIELAKNTNDVMQRFLERVMDKKNAFISGKNLPITLPMLQCINDIKHCKYKGGLKLLFLQARCVELLILQAEAFEQQQVGSQTAALKTGRDKDAIVYAYEYLLSHISDPPTIEQLAAVAGINTFKLKKGFKEMYDNTVFGCLNDARMQRAKHQLQDGVHIKSVAEELGYSSVQHFSASFKKKYGVTPGQAQRL